MKVGAINITIHKRIRFTRAFSGMGSWGGPCPPIQHAIESGGYSRRAAPALRALSLQANIDAPSVGGKPLDVGQALDVRGQVGKSLAVDRDQA